MTGGVHTCPQTRSWPAPILASTTPNARLSRLEAVRYRGAPMQTIAAYLLEKKGFSLDQRDARVQAVHDSLSQWLTDKGVTDVNAPSGVFSSETPDGGGTFSRETVIVDGDYAEAVVLQERANSEQLFITRVSVFATGDRVGVYASVSAANIGTTIALRVTHARCPSIVRRIIREHRDWNVNDASIPSGRPRAFSGKEDGEEVCRIIASTRRKFPLVLVSEDDEEFVWDGLDKKLAFDLIGLAYVSSIDSDAGWEISNRLGRRNACFDGAIRLYWPNLGTTPEQLQSTVWTAERILEAPANTNAEERFREQLRQRVMDASSLAITEPSFVGEIFRAHSRRRLTELQGNAAKIESVYELANSFADDLDRANRRIAELETNLRIAGTRAENAEAQLAYISGPRVETEIEALSSETEGPSEASAESSPIEAGQTIFYKKVDAAPHHDIMVRRGDCGHNSWKGAHAADKAWKGVERLEGRNDWTSFLHCSRCKGGGVWKVSW